MFGKFFDIRSSIVHVECSDHIIDWIITWIITTTIWKRKTIKSTSSKKTNSMFERTSVISSWSVDHHTIIFRSDLKNRSFDFCSYLPFDSLDSLIKRNASHVYNSNDRKAKDEDNYFPSQLISIPTNVDQCLLLVKPKQKTNKWNERRIFN